MSIASTVSKTTFDRLSRYNVSTPDILANQSILLVPYEQVQLLVDEINRKFTINELTVPGYPFTVTFFNDHAPKPQFLGVCNIPTDLADLKAKIEPVPWAYGEVPTNASEAEKTDLEAFMVKCRDMLSIDQWKNKSTREKREKKQVQSVNGDLSTLQQAQQCLGLRPSSAIKQSNPVVDLTQPAPCTPQNQPVLISIDVESYELDHSLITEIGVSTLDTQDFHDLAPGETGDSWIQKIRSRHFRIKGREHYINNLYCVGDADQFLLGRSEFITIEDAGVVVDSCFRPPFSAEFVCPRSLQLERNSNSNAHITNLAERSAALARVLENQEIADSSDESRRVLLIGHDLTSDTTSLSRLSSRIFRQSVSSASSNDTDTTLTGTFDTATLYKHLTHTSQPRKLGAVCHDLDIVPWHPHNAGNDARYTLEVFLKIALKASQQQQQHTSNDNASSSRKLADGILRNVRKSEKAGGKQKHKYDIVQKHSRTSRDDLDSESVPDPCARDSAPLSASRTLAPTGLNSVLDPFTSLHWSSQRTQDRHKRSDDEQTQLPIYRELQSDEEPY